jgi:hypothetical protein
MSKSMRHVLVDDGSVSKDTAPVSPRRTSQSPQRRNKDFKKAKSLHYFDQTVENQGSRLSLERSRNPVQTGQPMASKTSQDK